MNDRGSERRSQEVQKELAKGEITRVTREIGNYIEGAPAGSGIRHAFYDHLALQKAHLAKEEHARERSTRELRGRRNFPLSGDSTSYAGNPLGHTHELPPTYQKTEYDEAIADVKKVMLDHEGAIDGYDDAHDQLAGKIDRLNSNHQAVGKGRKDTIAVLKGLGKDAFSSKKTVNDSDEESPTDDVTEETQPKYDRPEQKQLYVKIVPGSQKERETRQEDHLAEEESIHTWFAEDEAVEGESEEQKLYREYNNFMYSLINFSLIIEGEEEKITLEEDFQNIKKLKEGEREDRHDSYVEFLWHEYTTTIKEKYPEKESNNLIESNIRTLKYFYKKMGTLLEESAKGADLMKDETAREKDSNGWLFKNYTEWMTAPVQDSASTFRKSFNLYIPAFRRENN